MQTDNYSISQFLGKPKIEHLIDCLPQDNKNQTLLRFFWNVKQHEQVWEYNSKEILHKIHQIANMLHGYGIKKNDAVAIVLPNLPENIFSILAVQLVGIVVPINADLPAEQIRNLLKTAQVRVLITLSDFPTYDIWQKIELIRGQLPHLEHIFRIDLRYYLRGFEQVWAYALSWFKTENRRQSHQKIYDFFSEVEEFSGKRLDFVPQIRPTDTCAYLLTNGTTNMPKLVRHSQKSQVSNLAHLATLLPFAHGESFLLGLPLWHVFGHLASLLSAWHQGLHVVLAGTKGFYDEQLLDSFWQVCQKYRIKHFSATPWLLEQLLQRNFGRHEVRSVFCGGDYLAPNVRENFEAKSKIPVFVGYGFTEGVGVSTLNTPHFQKPDSVGISLPFQEIKTVILDNFGNFERHALPNETGLIICRGSHIFMGYKEAIHNYKIWIDCQDGGQLWFNTGDFGKIDQDGFVYILGRAKDTLTLGENIINLTVLEREIEHENIQKIVLIPRPDRIEGKCIVAYVQKKDKNGADCEVFLAQKNISKVRYVDKFEIGSAGKIAKNELIWQEIQDFVENFLLKIPQISHFSTQIVNERQQGKLIEIHLSIKANQDRALLKNHLDEEFKGLDFAYRLIWDI